MRMKPGIKSTEFYGSAAATLLGAIATTGLLSPDMTKVATDTMDKIPEIVQIIDSLFDGVIRLGGLILGVVSQVKYGTGRANTKKAPEKVYIKR